MNWLLDSNILIDYLNGIQHAAAVLKEPEASCISRISWIEVLVGTADTDEQRAVRTWLARFSVVEIDAAVAETAIELRRAHRLRLPDALIWACARCHSLVLVSRNTRDFPGNEPGVHVPYSI